MRLLYAKGQFLLGCVLNGGGLLVYFLEEYLVYLKFMEDTDGNQEAKIWTLISNDASRSAPTLTNIGPWLVSMTEGIAR